MGDNEQEEDTSSHLVQRLMTADEVYVYKIPPLTKAGGHRAEDWNLSKPLKTCQLQVERRGDALVLEFKGADDGGRLFCQSQVDLTATPDLKLEQWLEQVEDSSRYFVVKIQQQQGAAGRKGREAMIGFGFRDRDRAIDLREAIQHYERSVRREAEALAKPLVDAYHVPKMGEGDTIHVNRNVKGGKKGGTTKSTITKSADGGTGGGVAKKKKGGGAVPLLKKKPPSSPQPPDEGTAATPKVVDAASTAKAVGKLSISMEGVDLDADHAGGDHSEGDSSGGAVFTGDDEQWSTEFAMK